MSTTSLTTTRAATESVHLAIPILVGMYVMHGVRNTFCAVQQSNALGAWRSSPDVCKLFWHPHRIHHNKVSRYVRFYVLCLGRAEVRKKWEKCALLSAFLPYPISANGPPRCAEKINEQQVCFVAALSLRAVKLWYSKPHNSKEKSFKKNNLHYQLCCM